MSEKLLFTLCVKCAENDQKTCNHTGKERQFIGTWTTEEVNVAIKKGYKVEEIYEVWNFKCSTDIFKTYISKFMKIKLESSEYSCYSSKEEYVADIEEKQGFKLDLNKIAYNPVKRTIAKLCMNSLYGKFGQRNNMTKKEFVVDPERLYDIILDDQLDTVTLSMLFLQRKCYNSGTSIKITLQKTNTLLISS